MAPPGGSAEDGVRAARVTQAECLLTKGTLLRQTGAIEDAMAVYADAWALVSRHGPQRLLGHVFNNLGVACFSRGNYGDALRLYLASIAVQREHGLRDRLGMALSNAGQAWAALGNADSALQYLRKSVEVYTAVGARAAGKADAHGALAELHAQRGELDFALVELERGRIEAEVRGDRYDLVRIKLAESSVALARGDARGARQAAERAAEVADAAGILYGLHARAMVAEAAALQGDGEAARRYLDAVLADPKFIDPARLERGDRVLASCERALRRLGENARADLLHALQQRRQAPRSTPGSLGA